MQIEIFTICDNVQSYNDKLVIVGTFNQIMSPSFPVIYPSFSIVGRILYEESDGSGTKKYHLNFTDPDGSNVIDPIEWGTEIKINENQLMAYSNFYFHLNQVLFKTSGIYNLKLTSDGVDRTFKLILTTL